MMNIKKYASTKVIVIVTSMMLVLGGLFNQHYKIKKLNEELYIQKNMTEQKYNYTRTEIDKKSIKEDLNKLCEYKVIDGTVNIKHTYVYERESILGLRSKSKLVGTADLYYSLVLNLKEAVILKADDNAILVEVDMPKVDTDACHRVANSFIRLDDECSENLLVNKKDAETATRHWEDTFDRKGTGYIEEYYNFNSVRSDLRKITITELEKLFEELGYSQSVEVLVR